MVDDKIKEENQSSLADTVIDLGEKAVAVGAGAAFLYRTIGGRDVSRFINKASRMGRELYGEVAGTQYRDYSVDKLKSMHRDLEKRFKTIYNDQSEDIYLRTGNSNSLMEKMHNVYQLMKNPMFFARKTYSDTYLVSPTVKELHRVLDNINGITKAERKDAESFVRQLPYYIDQKDINIGAIEQLRREKVRSKNPALEASLRHAVSFMQNQLNGEKTSFDAVKDTLKKTGEQVLDTMLNMDELSKVQNKETMVDLALDDDRARVRDLLKNSKKINGPNNKSRYISDKGETVRYDRIESLKEIHEYILKNKGKKEAEQFLDLKIDPYLRANSRGEVYSFKGISDFKESAINLIAGTLPGKLLKLRDIQYSNYASSLMYIGKGSYDPLLSGATTKTQITDSSYFKIYNKTYSVDQTTGELSHVEGFDNAHLISGQFGGLNKQISMMTGLTGEKEIKQGTLRQFFDIYSNNEQTVWDSLLSIKAKNKDANWMPNVIRALKESASSQDEVFDLANRVETFMQKTSKGMSTAQVKALLAEEDDDASKKILSLLLNPDSDDVIEKLSSLQIDKQLAGDNSFLNIGLLKLVRQYNKNPESTKKNIINDINTSHAYYSANTKAIDFQELLNIELSKEYYLRKVVTGDDVEENSFTVFKKFIEDKDLPDSYDMKRTGYTAIAQYMSAIYRNQIPTANEDKRNAIGLFMQSLLRGRYSDEGKQEFKQIIEETVEDTTGTFDTYRKTPETSSLDTQLNQYIHIKSFISPLDIIKEINDDTISTSKGIKKFFNQFVAGRDNQENVTTATMVPYFLLSRLGDDLSSVGLGFSNQSTGDVLSLAKTIGLKRLLPVAVAGTYYEYADDLAQAITGTGISATAVNGLANVDLFGRKVADFTGIHDFIDNQFDINPALQYWGGKDGFYSYDEEKDYYENGYEPVRKGRYWWFGSANEFRGGQIQYWQPNLVRRLNSDYYDKSLYDGFFDKWSHSLLPTPTNPISPLIYLTDPYWLENKHYNDRPYAVSGPMFERDTPWGIILNPTIGELIKPVKEMHEDRLYGGVDVKAMIYSMNKRIYDKAASREGYMAIFNGDGLSIQEFTSYSAPDMTERLVTLSPRNRGRGNNISIGRYGQADASVDILDKVKYDKGEGYYSNTLLDGSGNGSSITGDGFSIGGGGLPSSGGGGGTGISPINIIAAENERIRVNAVRNGTLIDDKLSYTHSPIDDALDNGDNVQELINASKGYDMVQEAAISTRLITGIYGYGANRAFGFGEEDNKIIAESSDIDSFSRNFWDMSIGGLGGGASEIYRRFIPEFRRNRRVNPLMNDMPEWIPERYRFGDPYAALPLGEARMPGKGYESLNELHPDQYGFYGAFDRYKILADIAPYSKEFKIWKRVAKKTIEDPELIEEMDRIQDRINEQSKTHDFYDYKFLGSNVDYNEATIKNIYANGSFTIVGSDDIYTLAGIEFKDKQIQAISKDILKEYINTGMKVNIATDANENYRYNDDYKKSVSAAVFVDGESLSEQLLDEGIVEKKKEDINAADVAALHGPLGTLEGSALEILTHTDIPLLSDRWLRIRSPLESYKAEQVYGTPYQTWSEIIGTTLMPALERSVSDHTYVAFSTLNFIGLDILHSANGIGKTKKALISGAMSIFDRGAFVGGAIGYALDTKGKGFKGWQRAGAAFSMVGNLYTSADSDSIAESMLSWGTAGLMVGDFLDPAKKDVPYDSSLTKKLFRSIESVEYRGKAAAIGIAAGAAAYGVMGVLGHNGVWVPDRVREKWETEEYFDRLNYIKYMGMYEKAKEIAKDEDGVDLDKIFAERKQRTELENEIKLESDVNAPWYYKVKHSIQRAIKDTFSASDNSVHRFEYDDGFSIEDLPGVHDGIFDSTNLSAEDRLYTLNALATHGLRDGKNYSDNEERDMGQVNDFLKLHHTDQWKHYEVHHIIPFSMNGADSPSNMIMLSHEDHAWITQEHRKLLFGEDAGNMTSADLLANTEFSNSLAGQSDIAMSEHTREALLYLQAAESTMFSVAERKSSDWQDIIKALPRYERDYFNEFRKERDPEKQAEILRYASPFQKRALQQVWDQETEELESNESYFSDNNLPNPYWEGWTKNVDLEDVKAKVVKNEGQMFSDYGIYESQYRDPNVINAPNLQRKGGGGNIVSVKLNLEAALKGLGLSDADVSVQPASSSGVQAVINLVTVGSYNIKEAITNVF